MPRSARSHLGPHDPCMCEVPRVQGRSVSPNTRALPTGSNRRNPLKPPSWGACALKMLWTPKGTALITMPSIFANAILYVNFRFYQRIFLDKKNPQKHSPWDTDGGKSVSWFLKIFKMTSVGRQSVIFGDIGCPIWRRKGCISNLCSTVRFKFLYLVWS